MFSCSRKHSEKNKSSSSIKNKVFDNKIYCYCQKSTESSAKPKLAYVSDVPMSPTKELVTRLQLRLIRDSCLVCGVIIIIISCIVVFTFMDDEDWTENNYMRQRILLIAVILFMTSTGLCLYVWKSDKKSENEHLSLLIIEKPPSYDSVVFQEPPPAYIAVVKSIHIIQQETTG